MSFILNTKTGILHTKECADGKTSLEPVDAGHRKHYNNIDHAQKDQDYVNDHDHPDCLGR